MRSSRLFLPGAFLLSAAVVEIWVRVGRVPAFVFPAPSAVLAELVSAPGLFAGHAATTLGEAGGGLGIATTTAFAVAALHSPTMDRQLTPLVVVSQTVPVIALAPLLVL